MTREQFLKDVSNWDNHRYLLWDALEMTSGEVVEMGCGPGSTPFLREYCKDKNRMLFSYENDFEWFKKFQSMEDAIHKVIHVTDWDDVVKRHLSPSVVLIDHAPGERRKIDIGLFMNKAHILVMHDTEQAADHGYQMRQFIPYFKYWRDQKSPGAWASIASNYVEV